MSKEKVIKIVDGITVTKPWNTAMYEYNDNVAIEMKYNIVEAINIAYKARNSELVNEIQKYTLPNEAHYLFLSTTIPRGKQYNKYVKAAKETKYEEWLVTLVAKHYCVSQDEAIGYLDIYYDTNKDALRELCENYGVDKKQLKKAKL